MSKRAVLVGINYKATDSELRGCINDINNIRGILLNNCGYTQNNVRVLTEESPTLPTRANMEANIKWLVSGCKPGDTLFFYYSGHGARLPDTNGDETDGSDEVLVPLDYKTKGVISDDWLFTNMVRVVPVNVTLWSFTDCCHSGTMVDLKFNYSSICELKTGTVTRGMQYKAVDWTDKFGLNVERSGDVLGNVYQISGCKDIQTSADTSFNSQNQGAFTFCFLEFLRSNLTKLSDGSVRFKNGTVKLRNLLKEVNCRLAINGFSCQNSQMSISKQADFERTFDL